MSCDWVESRRRWVVWGVPFTAVMIGVFASDAVRGWLWSSAFLVAGLACIVNAARCGRTHCFITGPLFVLASLASALQSSGWLPVGWSALGVFVLTGVAVSYEVEWLRGRYAKARRGAA